MIRVLSFLLCAAFITSCSKNDQPNNTPDAAEKFSSESISVDGRTRTYDIFLPQGYNNTTAKALVFALHGGGGTSADMETLSGLKSIAAREKFILVYPNGISNNWNDGRPTTANQQGVNDVNFINGIIDVVSRSYAVEAKKIYSCGISNGGFMSNRLACENGSRIAAVAVVAASLEQGIANAANSSTGVSMLNIQGIADPLVPFLGGTMTVGSGGNILSHANNIAKWVGLNACNSNPVVTNMPDIANDGTTTVKRVYGAGKNGTEVISYIVTGGGHTWPGGSQYLPVGIIGITSTDFNASEEIWTFFKSHPKL
jgi:polyhydroxybutyrate depolymerase